MRWKIIDEIEADLDDDLRAFRILRPPGGL